MDKKQFTLKEIAELTGARLHGRADHLITGVADLESASASDVSFLSNPKYKDAMQKSAAGAIFITPDHPLDDTRNFLIHDEPSRAFQILLERFHENKLKLTGFTGIHPTAVIHPSATIGPNCTIGPHAVIDEEASIGSECFIGAGSYIGPFTTIGPNSTLHAHVTIRERCTVGAHAVIQPGAVIGSCGFGLLTDSKGQHTKLNQVGTVVLEDDVEIGANTTIDRSRFKKTLIKRGTKIDNLVQIAHGVIVGEHCIIVSQTGIAGSTELGNRVITAGQVGIAGHLKIADGIILVARSGVTKSLTEKGRPYGGEPAIPLTTHNRSRAILKKIADEYRNWKSRLETLEEKINGS